MAFTIKYRSWGLAVAQDPEHYPVYSQTELISGPWDLVSQEVEGGCVVVHAHAHAEKADSRMTYGPWLPPEGDGPASPRPIVWVMNESGATVARYDL